MICLLNLTIGVSKVCLESSYVFAADMNTLTFALYGFP